MKWPWESDLRNFSAWMVKDIWPHHNICIKWHFCGQIIRTRHIKHTDIWQRVTQFSVRNYSKTERSFLWSKQITYRNYKSVSWMLFCVKVKASLNKIGIWCKYMYGQIPHSFFYKTEWEWSLAQANISQTFFFILNANILKHRTTSKKLKVYIGVSFNNLRAFF